PKSGARLCEKPGTETHLELLEPNSEVDEGNLVSSQTQLISSNSNRLKSSKLS
ncbi:hypothetical protein PanWU01x14_305050, partial [Parasponia andersonii]